MKLGNFSVSLSVKDIAASRDFYQKLGFEPIGGDIEQNWLILRNGDCIVGLFQGTFDRNTFTFNPGWNANCEILDEFTDVRDLQKSLRAQGVEIHNEVGESTDGPASFMVFDPDGNPILIDQHV